MTQPLGAPLFGDSLEIDELVVRSGKKRRYRYLWIVISRLSHQVPAYFVGNRSHNRLRQLWQRVPSSYRQKRGYTDAYPVYGEVVRRWQHRSSPKGSGRTSVIEGLNTTWRNRVAGLVRTTVCVQSLAALDDRLQLGFMQQNQHCRKRLMQLGWRLSSTR